MEDNNSFLESEIESSVSEEIDKTEEELSELEYKEIIGEDEAYMAELLSDSSEIDLLIQDKKTLIDKKKKAKKKKKPKKSNDEEEISSGVEEKLRNEHVSPISNQDPVQGKARNTEKKSPTDEPEETKARTYKINTIEELSHHIKELPKEKQEAEGRVSETERNQLQSGGAYKSEDAASFSEEIRYKGFNDLALPKFPNEQRSFSIYYLNKSKAQSEQRYADYPIQSKEKGKAEKERLDGKQESRNTEEFGDPEKKDYRRKIRISGEKIPISESIANAGKIITTAAMLQGAQTDSIDSEQSMHFYRASGIVTDVWESLGQMGLKASARMAKDASKTLEKNTAKTAEYISAGQISIDQLRSNEKAKVFTKKLEEAGINKKTAKYISRHRQEIADAIEAKIELSEFAEKTKDVEHIFAKTKVLGKNVILLSKSESDRQKKLLKENR